MPLQKIDTAVEIWQITYNWLLLTGNKPNEKYCREEITTHPDYPAMTAITDFLDAGNLPYQAVKADVSYIHEFNYPLLAHISQPGSQYMHTIMNAGEWDKQKEITQHWTGITLFPEKNARWQNEENNISQRDNLKNKIVAAALITIGLVLFIASSIKQPAASAICFGLLSLVGLVISLFTLGTELGYKSKLVKQVCGAVSNGGCEKVLKSRFAKGLLGISPADAAVIYFGSQFIFYLVSPYFTNLFPAVLFIALGGLAIAGWSIYTQAIKVKQWCALCLGIAGVLSAQALIASFTVSSALLLYKPYLLFALLVLLFALILLPIKQLITTNNTNRQKSSELKKWKNDAGLFITQWQQEQEVDTTIWKNDLLIGSREAPIIITVACNPYCAPCAKAHLELDELLHRFAGKIKVQVRLLCNAANDADQRTIAVKAISQKAETINDNTELQQMLTDWFLWMDIKKWKTKWKDENNTNVQERILQHEDWVEKSSIQFTPTFFINGRKLPARYNLKDIEILLPQLASVFAAK